MVDILLSRAGSDVRIIASDFNSQMLAETAARFRSDARVTIERGDLGERLPYLTGTFRGVVANLILPYVIHHEAGMGRRALRASISEIYRVLEPGGVFLWSSPKHTVNFLWVALASWRTFLDPDHPEYRRYTREILKHALRIQEWGRRELYQFLAHHEIEAAMHEAGFRDLEFTRSLAGQVLLIRAKKPGSARRSAKVRQRAAAAAA